MRHSARSTLLLVSRLSDSSIHAAQYCQQYDYWFEQIAETVDIYASLALSPPILVLLDLELVGSQFAQIIEHIRARYDDKSPPIVVLGPLYMQETLAPEALRLGASFFLPTPISYSLLKASLDLIIKQYQQKYTLLARVTELESLQKEVEEERLLANVMLTDRLELDKSLANTVECWVAPAQRFSGDLAMAEMAPDGSFRILLADGVGHGLSAALTVMPLVRTFRTMAKSGYGVSCIVHELNRVIRDSLPKYRFVAVSVLMVDPVLQYLECWNGGNPPVSVFNDIGQELWRASSKHVPLGIMEIDQVDLTTISYIYTGSCHVFMCSDGLSELEDTDGHALGYTKVIEHLQAMPPKDWLSGIQNLSADHLQGESAHDDISVAIIHCSEVENRFGLSLADTNFPQSLDSTVLINLQNEEEKWLENSSEILSFSIRLPSKSLFAAELVPLTRRLLRQIGPNFESNNQLLKALQILFSSTSKALKSVSTATEYHLDSTQFKSQLNGELERGQEYVGINLRALVGPLSATEKILEIMVIEIMGPNALFNQPTLINDSLIANGINPLFLKIDVKKQLVQLTLPLDLVDIKNSPVAS